MPQYFISKIDPSITLLAINRFEEISDDRKDICDKEKYLQISAKRLKQGDCFRPHKHLNLIRETYITQEAWIILSGSVRASFYDLDNSLIEDIILKSGDCAVVFQAGHSFEVLEENTVLYEVKNGPYFGQERDKTFISVQKEN